MSSTASTCPTALVHSIAQSLAHSRRTGVAWRPGPDEHHELSASDAYAIQAAVAAEMGWFHSGPRAWKVGGTTDVSAASLPEVLRSPANWLLAPSQDEVLIEAEVAFRFARAPHSRALDGDLDGDLEAILACLGTACVSAELIGSRLVDGLAAPATWKLADQGVHAGLVIAEEVDCGPLIAFTEADWGAQACHIQVRASGAQTATRKHARGSHPATHPLLTLPWLVRHASLHTGGLRAGDLVTTGAWLVAPVRRGDSVEVGFDGLPPVCLQVG